MNCSKANDFFMKYMDGCLSEDEAAKLRQHLEECEGCAEDFMVYDGIMQEFATIEICEAPEGFEAGVMARIAALPPVYAKAGNTLEKVIWLALGGFTVLMGIGFVLFLNRDVILQYMANYPSLAGYAEMLVPVSDYVSQFTLNVEQVVSGAFASAASFISQYKYVVLAAAAGLFGAQYLLYRRDKVEE